MPKANKSGVSRQAWNLLRLVLLWERRGRAFKLQLRLLVPKFLKTIGHAVTPRSHIWYGERELSFEKTPVVNVKMHRPGSMRFMLPCINPKVDFDMEFDDDDGNRVCHDNNYRRIEREEEELDIDSRAEEFIAKFYEQIKLQRQTSYLEYNEMLNRSHKISRDLADMTWTSLTPFLFRRLNLIMRRPNIEDADHYI